MRCNGAAESLSSWPGGMAKFFLMSAPGEQQASRSCKMNKVMEGPIFFQEDLSAMRDALERACDALSFAYPNGTPTYIKERLAESIVDFAAEGERSPGSLCTLSLGRLQPAEGIHLLRRTTAAGRPRRVMKMLGRKDNPHCPPRQRLIVHRARATD